ncbi:MAG: hypothetical protein KJZ81_12470 [Burkholderiaceae bacterium]|nr:hypothetical protein [Burkholderiaceae bacterium]
MLRRILTLLLCACLYWQGVGVVMASEAPCPMESELEAMVVAGELSAEDLPDCCNDMQTWADTGHLCKQGLDCASVVVWAPLPFLGTVAAVSDSDRAFRPGPSALSAPPGAPWRPPTGA